VFGCIIVLRIFDTSMNKITTFKRKQLDADSLYQDVYNIVHTLKEGKGTHVQVDQTNVKRLRKYLSDLSLKNNKQFATRKIDDSTLLISRLT
jgi:hypothetical protein